MRNLSKALLACALLIPASAGETKPKKTWQVTRTVDPITGEGTCVVASYDRAFGMSFTRAGMLYPVVENNARLGLLVGVSSGGKFRVPTGDILWRVDQQPHRTLLAANNPARGIGYAIPAMPDIPNQSPEIKAQYQKIMEDSMRQAEGMMATSTVASGPQAKEMLAEMLRGSGLIFRAAAISQAYGLPSQKAYEVGEVKNGKLRPIPLDESFRSGLQQCGISIE